MHINGILKHAYALIVPCASGGVKSNVSTITVKGMVVVCGLNPTGTKISSNSLVSETCRLKRT